MGWMHAPWDDPELKAKIRNREFASPTVRRWCEDIETIGDALTQLQLSRQVYTELGKVIAKNSRLQAGNTLLERIFRWYVDHTLMAIRRDVDRRRDVVSLNKLLDNIRQNSSELTVDKFRLLHTGRQERPTEELFSQWIDDMYSSLSDISGTRLDRAKVQSDIDALAVATDRLETMASESVAHRKRMTSKTSQPDPLYMKDVHSAVDIVERITQKYMAFLTGASFLTFMPVDQTDWPSIFTFPWRVRE